MGGMQQEWMLKRNCALAPHQLACAYGILCAMSLAVAAIVLWHGIWYVLGFTLLELTAVALAFLHYGRHATDRERVALVDGCLLIERELAGRIERVRLPPSATRIICPARHTDLIRLEGPDTRVEIGRFITVARRRQIARELESVLLA